MIKFDDDAVMKLYDLSYGIDTVDERVKYFATYAFETDGYRVFVEIKTEESIAFPRANVGQSKRDGRRASSFQI